MSERKIDAWFLGVDLGTGSCKTVVVDEKARILSFSVGDYDAGRLQEKWQEQDPKAILNGMIYSVREALKKAGELPGACAGMSIGGALHSLMAVDGSGNPLTGIITWADGRAIHQSEAIRKTLLASNLYHQTGCPPHGMYPLYKILWLREKEPEIYRQASRFLSAKEYIFAKLTGHYVIDYCLAAGTGLLNTHDLNWNGPSLDLAGITSSQLSLLCDSRKVFHGLDRELASQMGISPDTPLVLGSADAANSSLGAGAVFPWQATCMVGTSGALRLVSPEPVLDTRSRTWCYAIDRTHWLIGGAINNGGIAISWFQELLQEAFPNQPKESQKTFDDLMLLAGKAGTGAGGVICLPFFAGERSPNWNLNARAAFFGLTLQHRTEHLMRALLEGIAFRLRNLHDILNEISGDIKQVRASGGFTRSGLWMQIVANAIRQELVIPVWGETSCLGAALWALMGCGVLSDIEEAGSLVPVGETYLPVQKDAEIYEKIYLIYSDLYHAISPFFDRMASIE